MSATQNYELALAERAHEIATALQEANARGLSDEERIFYVEELKKIMIGIEALNESEAQRNSPGCDTRPQTSSV